MTLDDLNLRFDANEIELMAIANCENLAPAQPLEAFIAWFAGGTDKNLSAVSYGARLLLLKALCAAMRTSTPCPNCAMTPVAASNPRQTGPVTE